MAASLSKVPLIKTFLQQEMPLKQQKTINSQVNNSKNKSNYLHEPSIITDIIHLQHLYFCLVD
jgi:hypothetical protein